MEDNATTSSNGEYTDEGHYNVFGERIYVPKNLNPPPVPGTKVKRNTVSYKTELAKMTFQRNVWRAAAIIAITGLLLICLSSCQGKAQEEVYTGDFKVEFLFEHDGCKVYRFDDGRTVYFSDCRGRIEHTTTTKSGKTTTTHYHETLNN